MDLGTRPIRTAGRGSGSVEVTLPAGLRPLVGLPCRILLHDGAQPDIVVRPDLSGARTAFARLWRLACQALLTCPAPAWPCDHFSFALQPFWHGAALPGLVWQDGLALAAGAATAASTARCAAACAHIAADEHDIAAALAPDFAAACGFLLAGERLFPQWHEGCDLAASALCADPAWRPGDAWRRHPDWREEALWQALRPGLAAITSVFARWSRPGSDHPALQAAWRRGRSVELTQG